MSLLVHLGEQAGSFGGVFDGKTVNVDVGAKVTAFAAVAASVILGAAANHC
jgi:hypothetical protein